MALQYSPLLPPLALSVIIPVGFGVYAWRRREGHEGVASFALLSFACGLWGTGTLAQVASADPASQYFWMRFYWLGCEAAAFFLFVFFVQYAGWGRWLKRKTLVLLSIGPVAATLLVWTNEWHHLVWSDMRLSPWLGAVFIDMQRGPLWQPLVSFNNTLIIAGIGLFVVSLVRSPEHYRGQLSAVLIAAVAMFAAGIPFLLEWSPVDLTPVAFPISGAALAWGIFHHRLLDIVPAARHSTIEHMADAMLVLDQSLRIVDLNPAALAIVGRAETTVIGRTISEVLPAWSQLIGLNGGANAQREAEVVVHGRDYQLRISPVLDKSGSVTGHVVLLHDVTEHKQTRETLRRSEETSQLILESIEDGYYEIDSTGRFARATEVTLKILGLPAERVVGKRFRELTDAHSAERVAAVYNRIFQTGVADKRVEFTITTLDGSIKHLEASASLIRDAGGTPIGFRGIVRDTTERKRSEEELRQARRTAEDASKAKGVFLATVSHELRTPLTSVLGFAKLIKRRLAETVSPAAARADGKVRRALQQVGENVEIIVAEGERLTTLINDVLDLAKIESGRVDWNMQRVPVGDIVRRAVAATTSLSGQKGLPLYTEIEDSLPTIVGDKDRLIQVVINLLSNAIKFTDEGAITCRARRVDGNVEVAVTDTGTGIAPDDQDKVFDQFVQVDDTLTRKVQGTGLGLPICKQIVEHHGGHISVESALGCGSTFAFTLPLDHQLAEPRRIDRTELIEQLQQRIPRVDPLDEEARSILIVDDDPSIRALLRQELESSGYRIHEATTGEEALAAVKRQRPGLILLDVIMPGLSGFDVASTLRSDPQTFAIPIIILSVSRDRERGLQLGVDQYLTKPMSVEALLQDIENLLARGSRKRKVLVVDEDAETVRILSEALQAQGHSVVRAHDGADGIARAVADQPDLVLARSVVSERHGLVQKLRCRKGMEGISFLLFE